MPRGSFDRASRRRGAPPARIPGARRPGQPVGWRAASSLRLLPRARGRKRAPGRNRVPEPPGAPVPHGE
ncbi:hypothetical protein FDP22_06205 [Paroceanicella profunda]|uniref:Uncharacterized protein n=1 Tax=Paroceanicella profunda TaxID=2579971 RepID=A0A5B8FGM4_9RHOB|nr:hypothetical protein FDP22_06205 [Paroceanicella profunda]